MSFGEMSRCSEMLLCPFLNQAICYVTVVQVPYILDFNSLLNIWFTNIFYHSVGCLFALLIVSFAMENLLNFMSFVNFFGACVFGIMYVFIGAGVPVSLCSAGWP